MSCTSGTPYTVQVGDTLFSIAQNMLGNGNLYTEIRNADGTTPNATQLQPGQVLCLPGASAPGATQTTLKITNRTGTNVKVYLTLGRVNGCVQDVQAISFVTHPVNPQQGWFILRKRATKTYLPPQGQGISGNFAFGSPPLNCPTTKYLNGINLAEFMLNNNFQGVGAQETIDISCVAGANALIAFAMTGGGGWNAGNSQPNVAHFANKALGQNTGLVGVYPCGCDNCTSRNNPPQPNCPLSPPPPAYEQCQADPICNVQRDAGNSGGTVEVIFQGFLR